MWFRLREYHPPNHVIHWLYYHIMCRKSFIFTFATKMASILARCKSSWVDHNHWFMWLIYPVITLYSQNGSSYKVQVTATPMTIKLGRVRVKKPHLVVQVTCQYRDHVLFEKRHVSFNRRWQNSYEDSKQRKTNKSKSFFFNSKNINI